MPITETMLRRAAQASDRPGRRAGPTRRQFVAMSVGGTLGLALLPVAPAIAQGQAKPKPGQAPTEQPSAFVSIGRDGITTVTCNRMDMGQGIETALAMVCAEELDRKSVV
jgi:isoquinoline 1-oxidoreductase beta subunit